MRDKFKKDTAEGATVVFASTTKYFTLGPVGTPQPEGAEIIDKHPERLVYSGRKETVLLEFILQVEDCILRDKLVSLLKKQNTFIPKLNVLREFLEKEGITYFIEKKSTIL